MNKKDKYTFLPCSEDEQIFNGQNYTKVSGWKYTESCKYRNKKNIKNGIKNRTY